MKNFEVGDRVVYVDEDGSMSDPQVGTEGTIVYIDNDETILVAFDDFNGHAGMGQSDENNSWWVTEYDIKPITLSVYPKLKVGDRVRYFNEYGDSDDPENGSIGVVVEANEGRSILVSFEGFDGHSGCGKLDKQNGWWVNRGMLELVEEDTFIAKLSKDYLSLIAQIMHDGSAEPEERIRLIQEEIEAYNVEVEEYKTERPFKVGDILVGLDDKRYWITNTKSIVKVVDVPTLKYDEGFIIVVEVIAHSDIDGHCYVGRRFDVFEEDFRKVIE